MGGVGSMSRWVPLAGWLVALTGYGIAVWVTAGSTERVFTIAIWTLVPMIAAIECFRTAGRIADRTRIAWLMLGLACAIRMVGHLYWEYYSSTGEPHPVVHNVIGQTVYLAYTVLIIKAITALPESSVQTRFTPEHLGNLSLIACCFAVTVIITLFEPVAGSTLSNTRIVVASADAILAVGMFFLALFYLWTYSWRESWIPILLIVGATCAYSIGNFIYAPDMLAGTYSVSAPATLSWIVTFLLFAQAARERRHARLVSNSAGDAAGLHRERLLEAVIPALLIIILVVVAVLAGATLTPRVMMIAAPIVVLFAIILGAREAWIQGEAQRLTSKLREANEKLRIANSELRASEARYRDLNLQLEHRVAERTSQLTSAYQELEGFAYAVAHDLKAPLRAIDGFGHLLAEELREQSDGASNTYLQRMRHNAIRMSILIDDLLAYSRLERQGFELAPFKLSDLVRSVLDESAEELHSRAVDVRVDVPDLTLNLDAEGLSLALRNLLQNALKFTRDVRSPRIAITAQLLPNTLVISVADNGIGFDMQYHDQIFKLFHRLHRENQYPGTGIGLALVRKAVERFNGRVWAESREGQGATFYIEIGRNAVIAEAPAYSEQRALAH
jgi:signal transduction histidine kinase